MWAIFHFHWLAPLVEVDLNNFQTCVETNVKNLESSMDLSPDNALALLQLIGLRTQITNFKPDSHKVATGDL
jgi:hypothetical protein